MILDQCIIITGVLPPLQYTVADIRYNGAMADARELSDLVTHYNYDAFTREKVMPWLNFEESPPLGSPAPDFPLWDLDGQETSLSQIWSQHLYTIVEFGSFT